jgi:peptidoglycan/LPS O-acetylase OafA/YrhL
VHSSKVLRTNPDLHHGLLSGLLITNILLEAKQKPDYFGRFYKRRALRILPAYYMLLLLLAIYGTPRAFLGISLLHAADLAPFFGITMAYVPLWSLAVEEQFYLIWPLIIRRFKTSGIIAAGLGIFVISLGFMLQLHTSVRGLILGTLLAIFLRSRIGHRRNVRKIATVFAVAGSAMISTSAWVWQGLGWDVLFAAVLLFALLVGSSKFEGLLRPKALLFFGDISYGLYLIHSLVFIAYRRILHPTSGLVPLLIQFAVCSAIATGIAAVSRFTIEEWFLRLKDRPLLKSKLGWAHGEPSEAGN